MAKLLYVESSPRKDRSTSIAVARDFLKAYAAPTKGAPSIEPHLWRLPRCFFDYQT